MKDWNFGDAFPSIEIDPEYWQKLNGLEKFSYLKKLVFQEKDFGNRINLINFILSNTAKIGRSVVKNPDAREYFDILENSVGLISVLAAVGNIAKVKQTHKSTKNNEIAKLMGFSNGNYINEMKLDITGAMADAFVDISDFNKTKFGLIVDNLNVDDEGKKQKDDQIQTFTSKTIKATGMLDGDKWGLIIKRNGTLFDEEDTTGSCTTRLYYPVSGLKVHPEIFKENIQRIIYQLYIDKVDTHKNFVKIKGTKLEICERKEIDIDITNIDVPKITKAMRKVLDEGSRRGIVFVGEPGVGKTICVHKLTNYFREILVFWVSPDSINTTTGIRNVFKIFKMFDKSIMVFDDLDSGPFTAKDEVLGDFIAHLDGTNNNDLHGIIIGTVNDPSKLHSSLLNRPERIDDVIHVKNPQTAVEIANIIFTKAKKKGYIPKEEYDKAMKDESLEDIHNAFTDIQNEVLSNFNNEVNSDLVDDSDDSDSEFDSDDINDSDDGFESDADDVDFIRYLDFSMDDPRFLEICEDILKAKFTQAQVAGLINDCHIYSENDKITIDLLADRMTARFESIANSNKIAKKGRLSDDPDHLSDEAYGNLNKRRSSASL